MVFEFIEDHLLRGNGRIKILTCYRVQVGEYAFFLLHKESGMISV